MKKTGFTKAERGFLLAAAAACAVSVALAFWFAVPLQAETLQHPQDSTPLIQLARVDLNTAGLEALCTLPGVGEKRAQAIIAYRDAHGAFSTVSDAAAVPGLTEDIVASWAELAYVS